MLMGYDEELLERPKLLGKIYLGVSLFFLFFIWFINTVHLKGQSLMDAYLFPFWAFIIVYFLYGLYLELNNPRYTFNRDEDLSHVRLRKSKMFLSNLIVQPAILIIVFYDVGNVISTTGLATTVGKWFFFALFYFVISVFLAVLDFVYKGNEFYFISFRIFIFFLVTVLLVFLLLVFNKFLLAFISLFY